MDQSPSKAQQQQQQKSTQATKQSSTTKRQTSKHAASSQEASQKPIDAQTIEAILHSMGVDKFDPRVTHQILELLYRYVSTVLTEARVYSEHADKAMIDAEDIKLAVRMKNNLNFCQPPPRDVTMRLAAERNAIPLPTVDDHAGVALPPSVYQITRQNFRILQANQSQKRARTSASPPHSRATTPRLPGLPLKKPDGDVIVIDGDVPPPSKPTQSPSSASRAATSGPQPMEVVDLDAPTTTNTASNSANARPNATTATPGPSTSTAQQSTMANANAPPPPPPSRPSQ